MAAAAEAPQGVPTEEIVGFVVAWAGLALAGAVVFGVLRLFPSGRGWVLPAQRQRAVAWTIMDILLVGIAFLGWQQIALYLVGLGQLPARNTPQAINQMFLAAGIAAPLQVLTIIAILWRTSDIRLFQIGIGLHRWTKDVQAGWLFWLVLAPLSFGMYWGVRLLMQNIDVPFVNPFEAWAKSELSELQIAIFAVSVIVSAPLVEELVFRGVLQPWLITNPRASDLIMLAAIAVALWAGATLSSWWPLLFLFIAAPGYLLFEAVTRRWLRRPDVARGIYTASLLFAALHFTAWPQPIPLFVLSLGLGILAFRTQSILGPILVHSLFNAINVVAFFKERAGW